MALLAVGALIVIYFRSKKDTEQALKAVTPQPATSSGTQPGYTTQTVNPATASTFLPVVVPAGSTGNTTTRYVNGSFYGNVAAGGGGTSMNGGDPTLNGGGTSGTGTSGGGGGTSYNPGTI